ncbi:MAG: hypothetical protein DMG01_09240 [Acidobacteria bacterium]|nr:MAG: hypothetical protein DMG01_09240 [Acidobacteriota bacterium]
MIELAFPDSLLVAFADGADIRRESRSTETLRFENLLQRRCEVGPADFADGYLDGQDSGEWDKVGSTK